MMQLHSHILISEETSILERSLTEFANKIINQTKTSQLEKNILTYLLSKELSLGNIIFVFQGYNDKKYITVSNMNFTSQDIVIAIKSGTFKNGKLLNLLDDETVASRICNNYAFLVNVPDIFLNSFLVKMTLKNWIDKYVNDDVKMWTNVLKIYENDTTLSNAVVLKMLQTVSFIKLKNFMEVLFGNIDDNIVVLLMDNIKRNEISINIKTQGCLYNNLYTFLSTLSISKNELFINETIITNKKQFMHEIVLTSKNGNSIPLSQWVKTITKDDLIQYENIIRDIESLMKNSTNLLEDDNYKDYII